MSSSGDSAAAAVTFAPLASQLPGNRARPAPKRDTFGLGYDPSAPPQMGAAGSGDALALRMSRDRHRLGAGGAGAYHTDDLFGKGVSGRGGLCTPLACSSSCLLDIYCILYMT